MVNFLDRLKDKDQELSDCLEIFSDEGGHVSDDRPASRESMFNDEYVEEE
jgi:hypothetical protein